MIRCVFYSRTREEGEALAAAVRSRAAMETDDDLDCVSFQDPSMAAASLKKQDATAIGWDMSRAGDRTVMESLRELCRNAFLLVVANQDTSPLTYLSPRIAPDSLILRPFTRQEIQRVAGEILRGTAKRVDEDEACFAVLNRGDHRRIPYSDIYYLEARNRKLYVRLRTEEIGFNGILDKVQEDLPDQFRRCHRSYIVNLTRIEHVQLSENLIYLTDGLTVPLSRGYKQELREWSHG